MANSIIIEQTTAKHQVLTMWQTKVKRIIFLSMALGTMMVLGCANPPQPQSTALTQPLEAAEPSPHGLPYTQRFIAKWADTDIPAANMRYQIKNAAGQIVMEGRTNGKGETALSESLLPDSVSVELFGD